MLRARDESSTRPWVVASTRRIAKVVPWPHSALDGVHHWCTRHRWIRFAPAALVAIAMRARFVTTPITSDEGGFLGIARAWSRGARLYDRVWVDRPQGLLVAFRLLDAIGLGNPAGVRMLGIVACVAGSIAAGVAAEQLFATSDVRRASTGVLASIFVAVFTSVPQYEGFVTNGELLSGSVGVVGLAFALRATRRGLSPSYWGLLGAGAFAGLALSLKQSAFDAFGCALLAIAWSAHRSPSWSRRARYAVVPVALAGSALPVVAMIVHGAVTGWNRFWYAVAGYRMEQRSALVGADWQRFDLTWPVAAPALVPVAVLVLVGGALALLRPAHRAAIAISTAWIVLSLAAFLSGGQFHRHYWVILAFPLGMIGAGVITTVPARWARYALAALVLWSPVRMTVQAIRLPTSKVPQALSGDTRLNADEDIAAWFDRRAQPGDTIDALCASAGLYGNVSTDPPVPYLWLDNVRNIDGAGQRIAAALDSPTGPRFVAVYEQPSICDPSGGIARALSSHYRRVASVDGIAIQERDGPTSTTGATGAIPSRS